MTRVELKDGLLKVEMLGWDKIWALKSRLEFPLGHMVGARRYEKEKDRMGWTAIRAPGTSLPGVIVAGTYHWKGKHLFYNVHNFKNAVVIELKDEWFSRLVVEVPEPDELLRAWSMTEAARPAQA